MVDATEFFAKSMTEAQLQEGVEARLKAYGWRWYHTRDSRRSAYGFPDICAVRSRDGRLIFAELKVEDEKRGKLTEAQEAWLADICAVRGVRAYLWRPRDLLSGLVDEALR